MELEAVTAVFRQTYKNIIINFTHFFLGNLRQVTNAGIIKINGFLINF